MPHIWGRASLGRDSFETLGLPEITSTATMARNPRYDLLFEPLKIGPVTAPNRFYQVPHCTGMGMDQPGSLTRLREIKAEGGWGVVNTEYCSIHPTSDDAPYRTASLWDDRDTGVLANVADGIHRHGALAGVELWHGGIRAPNRASREVTLSVSGGPGHYIQPLQTRAMDREDIRAVLRWQRDSAKRAMQAGFDVVYCYAGHGYLAFQFISRRWNRRIDEYGGPIENRARLLREMIEVTKDAVGHKCAVAVRLAMDELMGEAGVTHEREGREVVEMLAELPDLWDVNISYVENDSMSARFSAEGFQEKYVSIVKKLTTKPVVGVGRFTSPDLMVSQIKRGVLDLIGAARPSIADPWLPRKIAEGREDEIRECIGCNICRAHNNMGVALRCTQNPTMGEEYRRGWHPEILPPATKFKEDSILVVGGGPAGLECAASLGKRGYRVMLAEARRELGGRVSQESRLPGLSSWARVRDYRLGQLGKLANVEVFLESNLSSADIASMDCRHVVLATGARWRRDGVGYANSQAVVGAEAPNLWTPDDILAGKLPQGDVVIYDDDQYYMAGVIAEKLIQAGCNVTFVTPGLEVSAWTTMTDEQMRVQTRLMAAGVVIHLARRLAGWDGTQARFVSIYDGAPLDVAGDALLIAAARETNDGLARELLALHATGKLAQLETIRAIGDCYAPGAIFNAVYAGHRLAREFDQDLDRDRVGYTRETVSLS
jgi:dimethylamine/trimethylamine dehydrogenase